jgi:hypothetical protein
LQRRPANKHENHGPNEHCANRSDGELIALPLAL